MAEGTISTGMASAICVDWSKKEILLVFNTDQEKPSNSWGLPGGKMKSGETVEAAVLRELGQETNQDGRATKYRVEIPKVGPNGAFIHTFMLVRIISEGKELKNNENPKAIPNWIPFQAIFSGKVKMFPSHVRGLALILEKMTEQKNSGKGKVDRNGIPIISEGPSALLETLDELKNAFDAKERYIIPFYRKR